MDNRLYFKWSKYIDKVLKEKDIPRTDSEDIKQDIFLHLLEYPPDRTKYKIKNIILKTINQCIFDHYKEDNKIKLIRQDIKYDNLFRLGKNFDKILDKADLDDYTKSDVVLKLEECINTLSNSQKRLLDFLLNDGFGYLDYKKKYPNSTKTEFYRAKKDLKYKLTNYLNNEEKE